MMRRALAVISMALVAAIAWAAPPRSFDAKSPQAIAKANQDRPYVLVLWSIYCEPCREEMHLWGALQRKYPRVAFVLVSTDLPQDRAAVEKYLAQHDLRGVDSWIVTDEFSERVRYAIDPSWRGELPRTYLFDAQHRRQIQSGTIDPKALQAWLAEQQRAAR